MFLQLHLEVQKWVIYIKQMNFNLFIQACLPMGKWTEIAAKALCGQWFSLPLHSQSGSMEVEAGAASPMGLMTVAFTHGEFPSSLSVPPSLQA